MTSFKEWCQAATTQRKVHGWATILWIGLTIPGVLWWKYSIPFLVFVSIYANIAGHWSSWQAVKVEVKQEEMDNAEAQMPEV